MPIREVTALTRGATEEQQQAAIRACISQMSGEHPDWEHDRVVAACHEMVREQAGGEPAAPRRRGAEHTAGGMREF